MSAAFANSRRPRNPKAGRPPTAIRRRVRFEQRLCQLNASVNADVAAGQSLEVAHQILHWPVNLADAASLNDGFSAWVDDLPQNAMILSLRALVDEPGPFEHGAGAAVQKVADTFLSGVSCG